MQFVFLLVVTTTLLGTGEAACRYDTLSIYLLRSYGCIDGTVFQLSMSAPVQHILTIVDNFLIMWAWD